MCTALNMHRPHITASATRDRRGQIACRLSEMTSIDTIGNKTSNADKSNALYYDYVGTQKVIRFCIYIYQIVSPLLSIIQKHTGSVQLSRAYTEYGLLLTMVFFSIPTSVREPHEPIKALSVSEKGCFINTSKFIHSIGIHISLKSIQAKHFEPVLL